MKGQKEKNERLKKFEQAARILMGGPGSGPNPGGGQVTVKACLMP